MHAEPNESTTLLSLIDDTVDIVTNQIINLSPCDIPYATIPYFRSEPDSDYFDCSLYSGVIGMLCYTLHTFSGDARYRAELASSKILNCVLDERNIVDCGPLLTTTFGAASLLLNLLNGRNPKDAWNGQFLAVKTNEYSDSLLGSIGMLQTLLSSSSHYRSDQGRGEELIHSAQTLSEHIASHLVINNGQVRLFQDDGSVQPVVGVAHGTAGLVQLLSSLIEHSSLAPTRKQELHEYTGLLIQSELAHTRNLPFGVSDYRTIVRHSSLLTWKEVCDIYNTHRPMEGWCSGEAGILEEAIRAGHVVHSPDLLERTLRVGQAGAAWASRVRANGHLGSLQQLYICHGLTSPLSMLNSLISRYRGTFHEMNEFIVLQELFTDCIRELPAALVSEFEPACINLSLFNGFAGFALASRRGSVSDLLDASVNKSDLSTSVADAAINVLFPALTRQMSLVSTQDATDESSRIEAPSDLVDLLFKPGVFSSYLFVLVDKIVRSNHHVNANEDLVVNLRGTSRQLRLKDGAWISESTVQRPTDTPFLRMKSEFVFDECTLLHEVTRYFSHE